jgi:hypothetical protein
MPSLDVVLKALHDYGLWGVVVAVLVFMLLNGEILFRYGHRRRKNKNNNDHR